MAPQTVEGEGEARCKAHPQTRISGGWLDCGRNRINGCAYEICRSRCVFPSMAESCKGQGRGLPELLMQRSLRGRCSCEARLPRQKQQQRRRELGPSAVVGARAGLVGRGTRGTKDERAAKKEVQCRGGVSNKQQQQQQVGDGNGGAGVQCAVGAVEGSGLIVLANVLFPSRRPVTRGTWRWRS